MSSKSKKGGIKRTNKAHQTSSGKSAAPKKTINRKDKNASHSNRDVQKKVIKRKDKGAQSSVEAKSGGVKSKGIDRNATSKEPVKSKGISRGDRNAPVKQEKVKTVTRRDKGARSTQEHKASGPARSGKMMQTSSSLGIEKATISTKKGVVDRNKQCSSEAKAKGVSRSAKSNQTSTGPAKEKVVKRGAQGGAFSQSSHEAKPRSKKNNAMHTSSGGREAVIKPKKNAGGKNMHAASSNTFGGGSSSGAAQPRATKNTSHMQSSFQFG